MSQMVLRSRQGKVNIELLRAFWRRGAPSSKMLLAQSRYHLCEVCLQFVHWCWDRIENVNTFQSDGLMGTWVDYGRCYEYLIGTFVIGKLKIYTHFTILFFQNQNMKNPFFNYGKRSMLFLFQQKQLQKLKTGYMATIWLSLRVTRDLESRPSFSTLL